MDLDETISRLTARSATWQTTARGSRTKLTSAHLDTVRSIELSFIVLSLPPAFPTNPSRGAIAIPSPPRGVLAFPILLPALQTLNPCVDNLRCYTTLGQTMKRYKPGIEIAVGFLLLSPFVRWPESLSIATSDSEESSGYVATEGVEVDGR